MNFRTIGAIIGKDLKVVLRNKGIRTPLIAVPLVMMVVLPALASLGPALQRVPGTPFAGLDNYLEHMPAGLQAEMAGYNENQSIIVLAVVYFLAPLFLTVPLMFVTVIAADSFAGEKERKTLEALLYTPTTDRELFLAKVLVAWIPALAIAWGGFVPYALVANLAAWPTMGQIFFPNAMWIVLLLWVAPAVAGLGLSVTVLISARARSAQAANQLGATVILPLLLLIIGQATGLFYLSFRFVLMLGLVLWTLTGALLIYGGRVFRRTKLGTHI